MKKHLKTILTALFGAVSLVFFYLWNKDKKNFAKKGTSKIYLVIAIVLLAAAPIAYFWEAIKAKLMPGGAKPPFAGTRK